MLQETWKELQPHVVELLVGLLAAVGLFVRNYLALLAARTEAQRQAVLGAAHAVDQSDMDGPDKKDAAIKLAASRLPNHLGNEKKLGELVQSVMPLVQAQRASVEPQGMAPLPTPMRPTTPD